MATKQEDEAPTSGSLHPEAEDHMLKMLIIDECFFNKFSNKNPGMGWSGWWTLWRWTGTHWYAIKYCNTVCLTCYNYSCTTVACSFWALSWRSLWQHLSLWFLKGNIYLNSMYPTNEKYIPACFLISKTDLVRWPIGFGFAIWICWQPVGRCRKTGFKLIWCWEFKNMNALHDLELHVSETSYIPWETFWLLQDSPGFFCLHCLENKSFTKRNWTYCL